MAHELRPNFNIVMNQPGNSVLITRTQFGDSYTYGYPIWEHSQDYGFYFSHNPKDAGGFRLPSDFDRGRVRHSVSLKDQYISLGAYDTGDAFLYFVLERGYADSGLSTSWPPFSSYLANISLTRAMTKLLDQKVNLAQELVEAKKTVSTFKELGSELASVINGFRHKHPSDWFRMGSVGQHASKTFLASVYGLRPLMEDINGAVETLNHRNVNNDCFRVTVHGSASDSRTYTWFRGDGFLGGDTGMTISSTWSHTASHAFTYTMSTAGLASLNSLGFVNLGALAWEELPFSFIVDWFFPIGSWLNSLSSTLGWDFRVGSVSLKQSCNAVKIGQKVDPILYTMYPAGVIYQPGTFYDSMETLHRVALYSTPVPHPYLKNPLSALHSAEATALVANAFYRGKRSRRPGDNRWVPMIGR